MSDHKETECNCIACQGKDQSDRFESFIKLVMDDLTSFGSHENQIEVLARLLAVTFNRLYQWDFPVFVFLGMGATIYLESMRSVLRDMDQAIPRENGRVRPSKEQLADLLEAGGRYLTAQKALAPLVKPYTQAVLMQKLTEPVSKAGDRQDDDTSGRKAKGPA